LSHFLRRTGVHFGGKCFSPRGIGEGGFAAVLAASAITIVLNEGFANWQALWLAAVFIGLAVSLTRARDAPG
jgi:hypothetical protein